MHGIIVPIGSTLLQELAEGLRSAPLQKGIKLHVAANAAGEVIAVSLTKCSDTGRAVLMAYLAIAVSTPVIKARAAIL